MPRYFFHLHRGVKPIPDSEGVECADDEAALAYGVRTVLEMLADDVRDGRLDLGWRIGIEDDAGREIGGFDFAEIFGGAHLNLQQDPRLRQ